MESINNSTPRKRPVVLCILDGWGDRAESDANAIALAQTPVWDRMVQALPKAQLDASAEDVGLPGGQMGNSEVGHMNLGAGRVVMQDLPRIDAAVKDGTLATNEHLVQFIETLRNSGGKCHLMGLLSPGGVHSHQDQMVALVQVLSAAGISVYLHAFMDGRDTPPSGGRAFMQKFLDGTAGFAGFSVATVSGRYYAMDRDNNWERVEQAWQAIARGQGLESESALSAIDTSYNTDKFDEFILPRVIGDYQGIADGDGVLMANFRADRARELLATLLPGDFSGFDRGGMPTISGFLGMVEYSTELSKSVTAMFQPLALDNILGQVVSEAGMRQLRIAETEKYAHVTFFLNGGREEVFPGEERVMVPSPKVATYDLQPEMSAPELTDKLIEAISSGNFDLIIVNYANGDMVGHTGVLEAAMQAAVTIDRCLGRLENAITQANGVMLVTADHGNCEMMIDASTGGAHTAHTLNKVPLVLINAGEQTVGLKDGKLSDIAPTLLQLLELEKPRDMTGQSLLENASNRAGANQ